jgi:CDP-paratose 2-epimerase
MPGRILITGGAGFIGANYVARLVRRNEDVIIYDNLSRAGARLNLEWLISEFGDKSFRLIKADVRDATAIEQAARDVDVIVHLAGQVAVTTSVVDPRDDFETNALGTFNVLEAARASGRKPVIIYASTNKVYGGMEEVVVVEGETSYRYADFPYGIPETMPLDFHSPYGCSKGCGDQYVRDYARIYELPTVVMRQSCIYGPHQFGIEDQGWVAWFVIAALTGKPITIYGDGKQVRDVLFVEDLLDAYDAVLKDPNAAAGSVFNIGGGPGLTMSVWKEFQPILERLVGHEISFGWSHWRPGDQRIYVSDIRKAKDVLSWEPQTGVGEGIELLYHWASANTHLFKEIG